MAIIKVKVKNKGKNFTRVFQFTLPTGISKLNMHTGD